MAARPTTELDSRFSDPDTTATSWEVTRDVLKNAELFWVTTVRANGRPHVTPLVAVWLDDALHFCTGATEQKGVNLRTNSRVVLMTGCNDWDEGIDVVVEGDAVRVTDADVLSRLAEAWATKWDGRWEFEVGPDGFRTANGGGPDVYAVAPSKVIAFGKQPFTHTSHRFDDDRENHERDSSA